MGQVLESMGEPSYRSRQVMQWLWGRGAGSFAQMTNVAKALRTKLDQDFHIFKPMVEETQTSVDGTIKFLFSLADGKLMESVLIPAGDHYTQCVSTQVGCPMGCRFCSTGRMGFERNLTSGEIAGQILSARGFLDEKKDPLPLSNLVFMGMGEPLLNWDQVKKALEVIRNPDALNFSRRKITLSSVGVKDKLSELGRSNLALTAISLHAPDQRLRKILMPAAAGYKLDDLIADLESYPLAPRERITIEYIMLKGVNDSINHARELVRVLSRVKYKINLLRFNPDQVSDFESSDEQTIEAFQDFLRSRGATVMLRKSMGADIFAACGQLKARSDRN